MSVTIPAAPFMEETWKALRDQSLHAWPHINIDLFLNCPETWSVTEVSKESPLLANWEGIFIKLIVWKHIVF